MVSRSRCVDPACLLKDRRDSHLVPHCFTIRRRPDPFGQSQRALRNRALCNKDFGGSGTLNGEWRPASDRVNDFRCRLRARECRIGWYGLPPRTLRGFRDRRRTETVAPGADLLRAAESAELRQPRPRPPRTSCALPPNPVSLRASWKCSRSIRCGRIAVQPISSDNPGRGRGAGLRTPRRRGLDRAHPSHLSRDSDQSRQGERYEAIVRAYGPEILANLNTPNWPEVMSSDPGVRFRFDDQDDLPLIESGLASLGRGADRPLPVSLSHGSFQSQSWYGWLVHTSYSLPSESMSVSGGKNDRP